jgi:hypothetical protein
MVSRATFYRHGGLEKPVAPLRHKHVELLSMPGAVAPPEIIYEDDIQEDSDAEVQDVLKLGADSAPTGRAGAPCFHTNIVMIVIITMFLSLRFDLLRGLVVHVGLDVGSQTDRLQCRGYMATYRSAAP